MELRRSPRILWLHADKSGCGTYRCYMPALTLEEWGFENHFLIHQAVPPRPFGTSSKEGFADLDEMDLVVFQRAVGTIFREWMEECRRRGIPTVYEMDDNLFDVAKHNPSAHFWHRKDVQRLLREELDSVDHLICSTPPLREQVLEETHRDEQDVTICYNHLHPYTWGPRIVENTARFDNGDKIIIGWQGSNTHDVDFMKAAEALGRIVRAFPNVVIRFFGNVPSSVRGHIPPDRFQWAKGVVFDKYPATLAFMNYDIGLAPITNSKFNQAKSNLKWLEYSALGVPTVASMVYPYAKSITPEVTGLLADTPAQWYDAIASLVTDAERRRSIGQAAKTHVWKTWSSDQRVGAWRDLFNTLLQKHGRQTAHTAPEFRFRDLTPQT